MEHPSFPLTKYRIAGALCFVAAVLALEAFALVITLGFPAREVGVVVAASAALTLIAYMMGTKSAQYTIDGVFIAVMFLAGVAAFMRQLPISTATFALASLYFLGVTWARLDFGLKNILFGFFKLTQAGMSVAIVFFLLARVQNPEGWVLGTAIAFETLQLALTNFAVSVLQRRDSSFHRDEELRRAG